MRRLVMLVGLVALCGAFCVFGTLMLAQTKTSDMDVGTVTLSLGTARDKVLLQLRQAGYKLIDLPPKGNGEAEVIVTNDDISDPVKRAVALVDNDGELFFRAGSLIRIIKKLPIEHETDRSLAALLYAIVRQYEKEGSNHLCSLGTVNDTYPESPDLETEQVNIICSVSRGVYRSTEVRWSTVAGSTRQLGVRVFQELWRD